jgi:hypothetical protein
MHFSLTGRDGEGAHADFLIILGGHGITTSKNPFLLHSSDLFQIFLLVLKKE